MVAVVALVFFCVTAAAQDTTIARFVDEGGDRVPTQTVVPAYPSDARRDRVEGEVKVCFQIDRKGRPYRVAVRDSTHRIFERPAMRAIKGSRYLPLESGKKSSGIKTCRTFIFELEPTPDTN